MQPYGTTQGSLLGAILFVIYVNDFPAERKESDTTCYVDDNADISSDREADTAQEKVQREAKHSHEWLKANGLALSPEKTKLMLMTTKERKAKLRTNKIEIEMDNSIIESTRSEKYLGMTVSDTLNWREHLYGEKWRSEEDNAPGLIPTLIKRLAILKKLSKYTNRHNMRIFTEGISMSKMRYSLPVMMNIWHEETYRIDERKYQTFTKKDLQRLQTIQNTAMRLITKKRDRNTPTVELLKETESMSVHQIGAEAILNEAKKIILTGKPEYLKTMLKTESNRRGEVKVKKRRNNLNITDEGFIQKATKLLNLIPPEMLAEEEMQRFKKMSNIHPKPY